MTFISGPQRPVRPWRLSKFNLFALVLIGFSITASLVGMALNYQIKAVALNHQLRLTNQLQTEREALQGELKDQEALLSDLSLQLRVLQSELAEVHAVREQILEVLPDSISDQAASVPASSKTSVAPAGGAVSVDELGAWTHDTLKRSRRETQQLLASMRDTYQHALLHRRKLDQTPSIWPAEGWVSSEFGSRVHPVTGVRSMHNGIDIAALTGTDIVASADGVVKLAGPHGGYGLTVIIDHDFGIETLYAHASEVLVKVGDHVRRGQRIARVGSTGLSTGPHLHYEIHRNSQPINPRQMLP